MVRVKRGPWLRALAILIKPVLAVFTRHTWAGGQNFPARGAVLVANHVSHVDPVVLGHFIYDQGRAPLYLIKSSLFEKPLVGPFLRHTHQIPVLRDTAAAGSAMHRAVQALTDGAAILVYPEGTTTSDPALWPSQGKSGAVRMALQAGVPLVPIVSWGAQALYHPHSHKLRLRPRTPVWVSMGEPIDLSAYQGQPLSRFKAAEATEMVMRRLAGMLAEIRGEPAPQGPLHARSSRAPGTVRETPAQVAGPDDPRSGQ